MLKRLTIGFLCLSFPIGVFAQPINVLSEDFESGLDAWTTHVYADPGAGNENLPGVFDADGNNLDPLGHDLYGDTIWTPPPAASQRIGMSSNRFPDWDGISPQWLERTIAAAVAPGTYTVTISADRYMWWCRAWEGGTNCYSTDGTWQAANQLFVLTDGLVDDGLEHLEDSLGTSGLRRTMWTRPSENGNPSWDTRAHPGHWLVGFSSEGQITTATGDIQIRLQLWEKAPGQLSAAWDDLTVTLVEVGNPSNTWTLTDDFEGADPLANWTYKLPGIYGQVPVFRSFTASDGALYDNINNPGTQSAGYSNDYESIGGPNWFWASQLFPGAVNAGVAYTARLEFDWYVYWGRYPLVVDPVVYPSAGSMYGANIGHNGTPCVGYENHQPSALNHDAFVWMHQLIPAATSGLQPGVTYDVKVQARLYADDDPSIGDWNVACGITLASDTSYSDPSQLGAFRTTRWANQEGDSGVGSWGSVNKDYVGTAGFSSATGDVDIVLFWQEKSGATLDRIVAFDDVVVTFTDQGTSEVVYTFADNFNGVDPLANWAATYKNDIPQPWAVGNYVHLLTDDQYDDPTINPEGGVAAVRWDGYPNMENNGIWMHEIIELPVTSTTGDIELRLTYRMKEPRKQVVAWDNVSLTFAKVEPLCGELRFDRDRDLDVDQVDFALLQACFTGDGDPDLSFNSADCKCFDTNNDLDVDQVDVQAFEDCASAPGVESAITCDDELLPPLP